MRESCSYSICSSYAPLFTPSYPTHGDTSRIKKPYGHHLSLAHLSSHVGIVLLEALGQALTRGHVLLNAARDAAVLALGDSLGGEIVDTRGEAVIDEVAKELFWGMRVSISKGDRGTSTTGEGSRTPTNSFTWRFCMRCSSSRCSACERLPSLVAPGQRSVIHCSLEVGGGYRD